MGTIMPDQGAHCVWVARAMDKPSLIVIAILEDLIERRPLQAPEGLSSVCVRQDCGCHVRSYEFLAHIGVTAPKRIGIHSSADFALENHVKRGFRTGSMPGRTAARGRRRAATRSGTMLRRAWCSGEGPRGKQGHGKRLCAG